MSGIGGGSKKASPCVSPRVQMSNVQVRRERVSEMKVQYSLPEKNGKCE